MFKHWYFYYAPRTHVVNEKNPFISLRRESALFFAEYWRRIYVGGSHSVQMVYDALGSRRKLCDEFYEAAIKGASFLNIETYPGKRRRYLDEMLYQGGLPMMLVTGESTNLKVWDRFTRGLVNRRFSFDELSLGEVAAQSHSMKDFCDQLIRGIDKQDYNEMPFYCKDENDGWYVRLNELAKEEKRRKRQHNPFNLTFEFNVDHIGKAINVKYVLEGEQKLAQEFLNQNGLNRENFFTLQIRKNGQAVCSYEFINNFCRNSVEYRGSYNEGDNIAAFLHNQEEPITCDDLDMDVPHLLYWKDNKYVLGNRIGQEESLLLIPEGWTVQNEGNYSINDYSWGEKTLRVIRIDVSFSERVEVTGADGEITFEKNSALYWTKTKCPHLCLDSIIEPVYNVQSCYFTLGCDADEGETNQQPCRVQYRNKRQSEWSNTPSYGEIFVRAQGPQGQYVTPIRLINVGEGININVIEADNDSCRIKVAWPHGSVSTNEGRIEDNDVWFVRRADCQDHRKIRFLFTPNDNPQNQFYLSIKAPFKNFSIIDTNDNDITNDCCIPYSDVERYQYHLIGQDITYSYGNVTRRLRRLNDGRLQICNEERQAIRTIPYQGSLVTLFDSRETLHSLLDRTSRNIVGAEVKVVFTLADRTKICISIQDSPYRVQMEGNLVSIVDRKGQPVNYTGRLKLLKLSEPQKEAVTIEYNEEVGYYCIPEEIQSRGKTLLIGSARGRILPKLVGELIKRNDAKAAITEELRNATIGDESWQRIIDWFNRAQKEGIPASSILELECAANSHITLLCLAFQLYVVTTNRNDCDLLMDKLKSFSSDLAFQWYWLRPYLTDIKTEMLTCLLRMRRLEEASSIASNRIITVL